MTISGSQIELPDGRRLGYRDSENRSGLPVFLLHGVPGSRLQGHPDRSIAADLGLRLIGVDRPGYGLSDPREEASLPAWPNDVAALADRLGLERFGVLGLSGGGAYAAACAWRLPKRVRTLALVSPMGPPENREEVRRMPPLNRWMLSLAVHGKWTLVLPGHLFSLLARHRTRWFLRLLNAHLPPVDREIFERPELQSFMDQDVREAFRQGPWGGIGDLRVLARPWGFDLKEIAAPVRLWHGEQDQTVPVGLARALAEAFPDCAARFIPDAGHLLQLAYWRDILSDLRESLRAAP
jgi:pimeloyl-ACP methyl ester carboxylesterase